MKDLLTGLTGSGKSTIAYALERRLFDTGRACTVLDGQNMRLGISKDLPHDAEAAIVDTPDRSTLWHAHTPQVFPARQLRDAYASGLRGTDDAALVEACGGSVVLVDGGATNMKVTRPGDVEIAEAILRARGGEVE